MLETNQSLLLLDLSRNYKAMTSGTLVVMRSLERNGTLKILKINSIVINECTFVSIAKCLERNKELETIEMQDVEGMDLQKTIRIVSEAKIKNQESVFKEIILSD